MPKEDAYVACPYYKRDDKTKICCEGVCTGTVIHLAFSSPDHVKLYKRKYCRDRWFHCRIADMLNSKYSYTP